MGGGQLIWLQLWRSARIGRDNADAELRTHASKLRHRRFSTRPLLGVWAAVGTRSSHLRTFAGSDGEQLENLTLRQLLVVLKRRHPKPKLGVLEVASFLMSAWTASTIGTTRPHEATTPKIALRGSSIFGEEAILYGSHR
jgi:hypothetical protein